MLQKAARRGAARADKAATGGDRDNSDAQGTITPHWRRAGGAERRNGSRV